MTDLDVENLVSQLSNLEVNSENQRTNTMPETNYQLLKLYVDTIPHYDGNPHTLGIFIDNCENLINTFSDGNNQQMNNFILRAIIGKLSGRALSLIGSRIELRTWLQIKEALNLSFGDQRNIDCLIHDLIVLRPLKNETPYNFGMRCQDARSLIISKLNTLPIPNDERIIRLRSYDDLSLKTFIGGLSGQIQNNVRLRNPDSLEKAMSFVIEEENFLYSQQRTNTLNSHSSFRPAQRIIPARTNIQNPQNFQRPQLQFRPNFQTMTNNTNVLRPPNFQSMPNYQPQNFQQPHYSFQPNLINRNLNQPNWRPNNNFPNQRHQYFLQKPSQIVQNQNPQNFNRNFNTTSQNIRNFKPEPMDTSSSNSRIPPKKNFTHTELFTQNIYEPDYFENPFELNENIVSDGYYNESADSSLNNPYNQITEKPECLMGAGIYELENQYNNYDFQQPDYTVIEENHSQNNSEHFENQNFQPDPILDNQT